MVDKNLRPIISLIGAGPPGARSPPHSFIIFDQLSSISSLISSVSLALAPGLPFRENSVVDSTLCIRDFFAVVTPLILLRLAKQARSLHASYMAPFLIVSFQAVLCKKKKKKTLHPSFLSVFLSGLILHFSLRIRR
ncbi:hypothetical protein C8R43DRAFT_709935 [Mycena crocata]|nr:hypothetical protein C8R43DRAFT_709935 [Mycena crocata]